MPRTSPPPPALRVGYLRRDLLESLQSRRPKRFLRAMASFAAPGRWPTPKATRVAVQDAAMARGSLAAARAVAAELAAVPSAARAGTPDARRRAMALEMLARTRSTEQARIERSVVAFLRGELGLPAAPVAADATRVTAEALSTADELRRAGYSRPVVVATFPGFHPNPYGALMETAYAPRGLAAVHVTDPDGVDAVVDGQTAGGFRAIVHLNGPDRFIGPIERREDAAPAAAAALARVDRWIARDAMVVASVHNGPRLRGWRGEAERAVAQGIVDRVAVVHVLTASTPDRLRDWITIDRTRVVHVPHPNFDRTLRPLPSRGEARAAIGVDGIQPEPIVLGLLGSLVPRKGCLELVEAFAAAPKRVADGRELRLVLGGSPGGAEAEDMIRRAVGDPRIIARLGYLPEDELASLLASLDVAVVPYADLLNSSWLHLALTAGIPVIAPAGSTAVEIVQPEALITYGPGGTTASLVDAIAAAPRLLSPEARAAARASVDGLDAEQLSARLADALLEAMPAPAPALPRSS